MHTKSQIPPHCIIMENTDLVMEKFVASQLALGISCCGGGLLTLTLKFCSWPVPSLAQVVPGSFGPCISTRKPSFLKPGYAKASSTFSFSCCEQNIIFLFILYCGCNKYAQFSVTSAHVCNFGLWYSLFILISNKWANHTWEGCL